MYPVMGYNTDPMAQPTRRGFLMSQKYALHLTASERQDLTRIAQGRGGLVFTPRHGSWLNMAEPELSVLTRQALSPRMATQEEVHAQVTAWAEARNAAQKGIDWQFRTADARVRLKHLYPAIET